MIFFKKDFCYLYREKLFLCYNFIEIEIITDQQSLVIQATPPSFKQNSIGQTEDISMFPEEMRKGSDLVSYRSPCGIDTKISYIPSSKKCSTFEEYQNCEERIEIGELQAFSVYENRQKETVEADFICVLFYGKSLNDILCNSDFDLFFRQDSEEGDCQWMALRGCTLKDYKFGFDVNDLVLREQFNLGIDNLIHWQKQK